MKPRGSEPIQRLPEKRGSIDGKDREGALPWTTSTLLPPGAAQERAEAQRQKYGARIQELERLGATNELAEYLVSLEIRIAELEQRSTADR